MSTETSAGAGVPPANLENLLTYVEYAIQVKAVNITAKDGTAVRIPEGQYSNPGYATTHAGGNVLSVDLCNGNYRFDIEQTTIAKKCFPSHMNNQRLYRGFPRIFTLFLIAALDGMCHDFHNHS